METISLRLSLLVLVLFLVLLGGCSTWHETRKETSRLYNEYVVPEASVDLDTDDLDEDTMRLATMFKPVDVQISELIRFLDGTSSLPKQDWFKELFTRFSWISGVMIVDNAGIVKFQHPETSLKENDITPLIELADMWQDHLVRGHIMNSPLGPEVYIASPLFQNSEWMGLVIVHFDPRKLLEFCPNPDELVMFTPGEVLWPGKYEQAAQSLAQIPWENILDDDEVGTEVTPGGDFSWIARNLGEEFLIYAALAEPLNKEPEAEQ